MNLCLSFMAQQIGYVGKFSYLCIKFNIQRPKSSFEVILGLGIKSYLHMSRLTREGWSAFDLYGFANNAVLIVMS